MDGELDRLRKLYGELGDEHLLDLARDRENLTEDGQLALGEELRKRRIQPETPASGAVEATHRERADGFGVGIPGVVPGAAGAVEEALEPAGESRKGMVSLVSFMDGMQLAQACAALEDADVEPAIEEFAGDAAQGAPTWFKVWVDEADVEGSQRVLRERMGLFPLAEAAETDDQESDAEVTDGVVASFETPAEAGEVRDLLDGAGFEASVETDTDMEEDGTAWSSVKVAAGDRVRALEFLERRLSVEER